MSANDPQPRWPAWGHDQKWAWRLDSIEPLLTVTETYLRSGNLHAVQLLDSDLNVFKVVDVRQLGRAGLFGWRPGFKGTYLRVEPVWQLESKLDMEGAKKYVLDFMSTHGDVYKAGMSSTELFSIVSSANSPGELFKAL